MKQTKRWAAVLLAAFMFVAVMLSLFVVAYEAGHDCIGENCPTCAVVALCRTALKKISVVLIALWIALCGGGLVLRLHPIVPVRYFCATPVSLKVELQN